MQINITMETEWTEDEAQYWLDFMLEEIWNSNASTEDNARLVNFMVDGTDFMKAYEGE